MKKTIDIANRAAAEGITPLEVMLKAMRAAWDAKDTALACSVAKDAAPYIHARLQAIEATVTHKREAVELSDAELARIISSRGGNGVAGPADGEEKSGSVHGIH